MWLRSIVTAVLVFLCVAWVVAWVGCTGRAVGPTGPGADGGPPSTNLPSDWTSCTGPGQCSLRLDQCCTNCVSPPLEHAIAVRSDHLANLEAQLCGGSPQACPALCARATDYTTAVCRSGACTAIDVRTDQLSACTRDEDCVLRAGLGCCATCGPYPADGIGFVAVARGADLDVATCPANLHCSPCQESTPPAGIQAACPAGHCVVLTRP